MDKEYLKLIPPWAEIKDVTAYPQGDKVVIRFEASDGSSRIQNAISVPREKVHKLLCKLLVIMGSEE